MINRIKVFFKFRYMPSTYSLFSRWVSTAKGISIDSAVFAQYISVTDTQTTLCATSVVPRLRYARDDLGRWRRVGEVCPARWRCQTRVSVDAVPLSRTSLTDLLAPTSTPARHSPLAGTQLFHNDHVTLRLINNQGNCPK